MTLVQVATVRGLSLLYVLVCCAAFPSTTTGQAGPAPLSVDLALAGREFGHEGLPLGISRSGWLAYTVAANNDGVSTIWLLDPRTGATQNVTAGLRSAGSPIWSPDGRWLAFFVASSDSLDHRGLQGNYEIWLWDEAAHIRRKLTEAIFVRTRPDHFFWSADSRALIAEARSQSDRSPGPRLARGRPAVSTRWVNLPAALVGTRSSSAPRSGRSPADSEWLVDVVRISVPSGVRVRLAKYVDPLAFAVAPVGGRLAMVTTTQEEGHRGDLWATDSSGRNMHRVIRGLTVGDVALRFSPNGLRLAVLSTNQLAMDTPAPDRGKCDIVDLSTTQRIPLSVDATWLHERSTLQAPLWWTPSSDTLILIERGRLVRHALDASLGADTIAIPRQTIEAVLDPPIAASPSGAVVGHSLVALVEDSAGVAMRVASIDLARKTAQLFGDGTVFYSADAAALLSDGASVVLGEEGPAKPFDFYRLDLSTGREEHLTRLEKRYDRYAFGPSRLVHYENASGEGRTAMLLLPAGYEPGKRYPTIIFERDRASTFFAHRFGIWGGPYNMQLYATRGYAVLYPDIAVTRPPRERVMSDILPAIDAVVAAGIADSTRLALYGHSLGAYHAMMLLVQTNRFRAAIVSQGYYNLFTLYSGNEDYAESFVTGTLGPPWQYSDRYVANSPYLLLGGLTTPVLLIGSSLDVYTAQGDELFAALARAKKSVEYIRYEGEMHCACSWTLTNRRDYVTRTLAWLGYWLARNADSGTR